MLETPVFAKAAVAAPHRLAVAAGREILAEGGNAIEAMLAMAATIAVVYPHMNGIGGDGFWLIRLASGKVHAIEAAGTAGAQATIPRYRALGFDAIPSRGPLAAVTIPGTLGGWALAREMALAEGGRLGLKDLLRRAIEHARDGYPQSASEADTEPLAFDALRTAPGFAATYLVDGERPKQGSLRTNKKLADTLIQLADAGLEDFYRGDIGRELAVDMEAIGAAGTREDLARFHANLRSPLSLALPGRTHFNTPPPTQGLASLLLLGIFERLRPIKPESFAHVHGLTEATKRAFAIRDKVCTDFAKLSVDPLAFLTPAALEREAALVRMDRATTASVAPAHGDTIWMGAIDADGRAVSFIQSLYWEYGSGCVLPRTGVLLQNRGCAFSLDPKSLNPLEPGRRPFHTLNPPLVEFADGRIMSYGSMGGDGQPQFQAQVFSRVQFGTGLAEAIDRPRFLFGKLWGSETTRLKIESRWDDAVIRQLAAAGHEIDVVAEPYSAQFGHAGGLIRYPNGRVEAMHDPRSDGGADGF